MNIDCPICKVKMELKRAKCKYGMYIKVNQCPNCGGIWGNINDINRIDLEKTEELDLMSEIKFNEKSSFHGQIFCPKCSKIIEEIRDNDITNNINFEICHNCGDVWLNFKTFLKFKKQEFKKEKDLSITIEKTMVDEEINKLVTVQRNDNHLNSKDILIDKVNRSRKINLNNFYLFIKNYSYLIITIFIIIFLFIVILT